MIYDTWDVVEVPFPFIETAKVKQRKALVLSSRDFAEHNSAHILMMITSATNSAWAGDTPIDQLAVAGLKKACVTRLKLFTLAVHLIHRKVGKLSRRDQKAVRESLRLALPLLPP